jgi:predicted amidohydrolase
VQDFTLALIQMNAPLGQVARNLKAHVTWARAAAEAGADLVAFPELSITGHWCAGEVWAAAEPVPDGLSTLALADLARELGVIIGFGVAEREAGLAYNTYALVGPEGYLGKQRKLQMSGDEYFHFRGGSEIAVLDVGLCQLGIGICYDNLFPEVSRVAAVRGAEVYLMPHAARCGKWPREAEAQGRIIAQTKAIWTRAYAARAYDNGMYVAVCNQAGRAGRKPLANHAGGSLIFDPNGNLLAESLTPLIEDEMVTCRLTAAAFEVRRRGSCFNLQTRRPELYGELSVPR